MNSKNREIQILLLGVFFGIFGNLVANYFDRSFMKYGFAYDFIVGVVAILAVWFVYYSVKRADK